MEETFEVRVAGIPARAVFEWQDSSPATRWEQGFHAGWSLTRLETRRGQPAPWLMRKAEQAGRIFIVDAGQWLDIDDLWVPERPEPDWEESQYGLDFGEAAT